MELPKLIRHIGQGRQRLALARLTGKQEHNLGKPSYTTVKREPRRKATRGVLSEYGG